MSTQETVSRRTLLVVDDDPLILRSLEETLQLLPVDLRLANSCGQARFQMMEHPRPAVILCDHLLPDGTGVEFLRSAKIECPEAVRLLMTGAHVFDKTVALQAINTGEIYRFLAKPFTMDAATEAVLQSLDRHALTLENRRLQQRLADQNQVLHSANERLSERVRVEEELSRSLREETVNWRRAFKDSVDLCLHIMERLDPALHAHSLRVAKVAGALGRELGLSGGELERLDLAALLHDLGLLGASTALQAAQRQSHLAATGADRDLVENHPEVSADLARFLPYPDIVEAIRSHHEMIDGSGYPNALAGDRIPRVSRILAVADALDEAADTRDLALAAVEGGAGRIFDAEAAHALVRLVRSGGILPSTDRSVSLQELVAGMRLAAPIFTTSGVLMHRQGQVLTDSQISRLAQHSARGLVPRAFLIQT